MTPRLTPMTWRLIIQDDIVTVLLCCTSFPHVFWHMYDFTWRRLWVHVSFFQLQLIINLIYLNESGFFSKDPFFSRHLLLFLFRIHFLTLKSNSLVMKIYIQLNCSPIWHRYGGKFTLIWTCLMNLFTLFNLVYVSTNSLAANYLPLVANLHSFLSM